MSVLGLQVRVRGVGRGAGRGAGRGIGSVGRSTGRDRVSVRAIACRASSFSAGSKHSTCKGRIRASASNA